MGELGFVNRAEGSITLYNSIAVTVFREEKGGPGNGRIGNIATTTTTTTTTNT